MIAGSIASQVLQCFAVLKGKRFLTGIINKLSMVVANLAVKKEPAAVLAATTAAAATSSAIADAGLTDASVIEELHNPEISIDEKVELLKDADVPEEKITAITKAVETETTAEAALKSEAAEAVNKANQEQMAAAATEKQQPAQVIDNNVNSVEQAPSTEIASSQPAENVNNEQVAVNNQTQEQPVENTNTEQVAVVNNQQVQPTEAVNTQQKPVENKPAYDTGTGTFLSKDTTLLAYQNRDAIQDYRQAEKEWNAGTEEIYSYRHGNITNADLKWEELSNEDQAKVMKQVTNKAYNADNVNTVEKIFDQANKDKEIFDQKQVEAAAAEQARIDAENARLEAERQAKLEAIRAENERVQLERQTQQNAEKQDAINTLKAQSAGYELAKSQLPRSDKQGRQEINRLIRGNKKAIRKLS